MSESKLIKDFRTNDVQRMRNLITKDFNASTTSQVGYKASEMQYGEGDIWEENGRKWTVKNGLRQTVTRFDEIKRLIVMPLVCPECKKPMVNKVWDKQMYSVHKKCFNCVIEYETELKRLGKFEEYEKDIRNQGIKTHIKEMENILLELTMNNSNESFVTEDGDIEIWKGNNISRDNFIKDIKEYIIHLHSSLS